MIRILNKKKVTGKDFGRLILLMDIEANNNKGAISEQIDLEDATCRLSDEQLSVYNGYVGLYHIIHTYNHLGQGCYQQALRSFYRLMLIISKPSTFSSLKSMRDEIDSKKALEDIETFLVSLKTVYAIKQFFTDVEGIYDVAGLSKTYDVWANLDEYIDSYNDVIALVVRADPNKYDEILSKLPTISEKDYIPSEENLRKAKKIVSDVEVFRNRTISIEFYEMYLDGISR